MHLARITRVAEMMQATGQEAWAALDEIALSTTAHWAKAISARAMKFYLEEFATRFEPEAAQWFLALSRKEATAFVDKVAGHFTNRDSVPEVYRKAQTIFGRELKKAFERSQKAA